MMRRLALLFLLLLIGLSAIACGSHFANSGQVKLPAKEASALRLATHNVHYILLNEPSGPWSVGDWDARKDSLDAAFKFLQADIIAFQEMESFSGGDDGSVNLALSYLLEKNPQYQAAAVGDWRTFPSTQPILYDRGRFDVLDQGWFFFSDTPDVIYSRTFNGSFPAFSSWVRFSDRHSGQSFYVFNVHFEYKSRSNRLLSADLVVQRIKTIAKDEAVFLVGDLNALYGSKTMEILEDAGLSFLPVSGSTYHFNKGINLFGAIDHIAHSDHVTALGPTVVMRQKFAGHWPSDHYPVFVDVAFARKP